MDNLGFSAVEKSSLRTSVDTCFSDATLKSSLKIEARKLSIVIAIGLRLRSMKNLEQEIESILLSVAVEKPKPDYSGVYAGLYVFPAMTEGFIRTCIVADIMKAARQYLSRETMPDAQNSVATGSNVASAAPRDLPAERAPGGSNVFR